MIGGILMGFKFIDVFTRYTDDKIDGTQSECDKLMRKTGAQYMKEWLSRNEKGKTSQGVNLADNKANKVLETVDGEREKRLISLLRESLEKFETERNPFVLSDMISLIYAIAKERGINKESIDKNVKL